MNAILISITLTFIQLTLASTQKPVNTQSQKESSPLKDTPEILAKLRSRYKDPKSCEAVYYDLFKNDKPSRRDLKTTLNLQPEMKRQFTNILTEKYPYDQNPQLQQEFLSRLDATLIRENSGVDHAVLFSGECNSSSENLKSEQSIYNISQSRIIRCKYNPTSKPVMELNPDRYRERSDAANAFVMGHEYAHNLDWAPDELISCLASSESYNGRKSNQRPSAEWNEAFREKSGGGYTEGYGTNAIPFLESLIREEPKDAAALIDLFEGKTLTSSQLQRVNEVKSREARKFYYDIAYRQIFHGADLAPEQRIEPFKLSKTKLPFLLPLPSEQRQRIQDIKRKDPKDLSTQDKEVLKRAESIVEELAHHYMEQGVTAFNSRGGAWTKYSIYSSIRRLEGAMTEQITEAVADYMGVLVANQFIREKYSDPQLRREAALSVLKAFPPELYSEDADKIMSRVNSKKPFEYRALRILLANPDFRELIGCQFEGPTPIFCDAKFKRMSTNNSSASGVR